MYGKGLMPFPYCLFNLTEEQPDFFQCENAGVFLKLCHMVLLINKEKALKGSIFSLYCYYCIFTGICQHKKLFTFVFICCRLKIDLAVVAGALNTGACLIKLTEGFE